MCFCRQEIRQIRTSIPSLVSFLLCLKPTKVPLMKGWVTPSLLESELSCLLFHSIPSKAKELLPRSTGNVVHAVIFLCIQSQLNRQTVSSFHSNRSDRTFTFVFLKSRERVHLANACEFNHRYLTCHLYRRFYTPIAAIGENRNRCTGHTWRFSPIVCHWLNAWTSLSIQ